jgi:hypothetical protein
MAQNYFNSDVIVEGNAVPNTNDSGKLGTGSARWSEINISSGANIIWGSGDASIKEGSTENYSLTFSTYNGTSLTSAMRLNGDNELVLNGYGSQTFTGTSSSYLIADSSGNIIEKTPAEVLSDIGAGTGVIQISGTPAAKEFAEWTNATTIKGSDSLSVNSGGNGIDVFGNESGANAVQIFRLLRNDSASDDRFQFIIGATTENYIYSANSNDAHRLVFGLLDSNNSNIEQSLILKRGSGVQIPTLNEIGSDTDKFLMVSGSDNLIEYVSGDNLRTYIGAGTGSGTMSSFTLAGDSGSSQTIGNADTLTVAGGTYIASVASATDTITLNHDSTTRNDTTSSASPGSAGTFTAVDSVTSNATGHVTAINVKTVTMPTSPTVNNNTITLAAGTGLSGGGSFTLNQGSDETITFTADNNGTVTGTGSAGRVAYWDSASSITSDGDLTFDGTNLTVGGKVITTEIESSGVIVLDAAGDITLDADGADIVFKNGGTEFGRFTDSSSDFVIKSAVNNKDIIFKGVDNNSTITSLTLDMSNAGAATFADSVSVQGDALNLSTDTLIEYGLSSGIDYNIGAPVSGTNARGERVSMYSTTGMTAGDLYVASDFAADWTPANNTDDDTKNMIVVAIGASSSTDKVLLRGIFRKASHGFTTGQPLYVGSSNGQFTATVPTSGYVRVVGYAVNSNEIYFCPDNTWVEIN